MLLLLMLEASLVRFLFPFTWPSSAAVLSVAFDPATTPRRSFDSVERQRYSWRLGVVGIQHLNM